MKRPLLWFLLFFIAGILAGRYMGDNLPIFLAVLLLLTGLVYYRFRLAMIFIFPIGALLGFVVLTNALSIRHPAVEALAERQASVQITGTALDTGVTATGRPKAVIAATHITDEQGEILPVQMQIQAYLDDGLTIAAGDIVTLTGQLNCLDGLRNPGGYNEAQYLGSRGIPYKLFADGVQKHGVSYAWPTLMPRLRQHLGRIFDKALPYKEAGIMKAMIIGDKSGLDEETANLYRDAGIYHILAVSGLHVTVLAGAVGGFLSLWLKKKTQSIALIIFLIFYCLLTGAGVSTVRAVIMGIVMAMGGLLDRDGDSAASAGFAALCLLLYRPLYLWDIGFQYSFAAVFGLTTGTKALDKGLSLLGLRFRLIARLMRIGWLKKYLSGVLAAWLATVPISACYFFTVSPISILVNLLLLPSVFIVVLCGFIICILGLFSLSLASLAGIPCLMMLTLYETVCLAGVSLPMANVITGCPPLYIVAGFYGLLSSLYIMLYRPPAKRQWPKRICLAACGLWAAFLVGTALWPKPLSVDMLDVGQGDSTIFHQGSTALLIDGGGNSLRGIGNTTGANVVVPYLKHEGVGQLSAAFVTHLDGDHAIGVIETMMETPVKRLFLPWAAQYEPDNKYLLQLLDLAKQQDCEVHYLSTGDKLTLGGINLVCLSPDQNSSLQGNDASLVLRITYDQISFLFTGDIGFDAEDRLLLENHDSGLLDVEVLKAAHHGSKYSTQEDFIKAASPKAAIIGAGRNNSYGHPAPETLERLRNANVALYDTARCGAISIRTDGSALQIHTMIPSVLTD